MFCCMCSHLLYMPFDIVLLILWQPLQYCVVLQLELGFPNLLAVKNIFELSAIPVHFETKIITLV